jgi:short subunit fatty acids transporter
MFEYQFGSCMVLLTIVFNRVLSQPDLKSSNVSQKVYPESKSDDSDESIFIVIGVIMLIIVLIIVMLSIVVAIIHKSKSNSVVDSELNKKPSKRAKEVNREGTDLTASTSSFSK